MDHCVTYRTTTRIKAKAIDTLDMAPYTLSDRQTAELRETILDTATRTLSQAQAELRVYHDGAQYHLRFTAPVAKGGSSTQPADYSVPIAGRIRDDRTAWPASIADPVAALISTADLHPLLTIRTRRRTWPVTAACRSTRFASN